MPAIGIPPVFGCHFQADRPIALPRNRPQAGFYLIDLTGLEVGARLRAIGSAPALGCRFQADPRESRSHEIARKRAPTFGGHQFAPRERNGDSFAQPAVVCALKSARAALRMGRPRTATFPSWWPVAARPPTGPTASL